MIINLVVAVLVGILGVLFDVSGGVFAVMILVGVFVIGPFLNFLIRNHN
tara:strand:+ start:1177 stop:1323 length:147 start_codon:yes stop_codon:yes gene_type:complete